MTELKKVIKKFCPYCKKYKTSNLIFFKKDRRTKDKLYGICKECFRKLDKEYQKNKRKRLIGYKADEYRKYRERNPEKVKAQQLLNIAIKSGKIKRSPCEVCGENRKYRVHAHHDDYLKPYEVRWLCPIHHKLAHKSKTKR